MDKELKTIRGTITRLFHSSPKWSAGKILPDRSDVTRGGEISVAGSFYGVDGEYVILEGEWTDHEKYGRQFSVNRQIREIGEISVVGLAGWLAVHGKAHGIGPVKAEKIAKEFGENFTGVLRDNPEQIAISAGVPLDVLEELSRDWQEHEELNVIGTQLAAYELTAHQIHALYARFKGNVVKLLEEDPYLLVGEIDGLGFKRVDEIARKVGVSLTHPGRLGAVVQFCLWEEQREGSTCMERGNLSDTALELLGYRENDGQSLIGETLERLAEKPPRIVPLEAGERTFYAVPSSWKHETFIDDFLRAANQPNPHFHGNIEELVPVYFGSRKLRLDDSQRRAVAMALRNRACLISGGAGAGKTTILEAIITAYKRDGLRVELCAPTGKASRRIEEVVGHEARTTHRMLGYRPPKGFPEPTPPLNADVIICDEASMIPSDLAYHLFRAIGPETALVLVGDHHQLPPVGAGALLRDCLQNELLPLAILSECHRQAGVLKTNCSAILTGAVHPTERAEDGSLPWTVMRKLELSQSILDYLEMLFTHGLAETLGVDPLRDVQFLTPQHGGPLGTRSLNVLFQRLHQKSRGVDVEPIDPDSRPTILLGDKVIQTKNNYKLEIMNGHQGFVTRLDPLVVDFGGGRVVAIPKESRGEIELAYALTVHKVQGSQFPVVVFVCHKSHSFMLHRNLLYTAATRAQKSCVIVGDDQGVSTAAKKVKVNERRTLLPLLAQKKG